MSSDDVTDDSRADAGATWAGTHVFRAPHVVEATSVAEVRAAIRRGGPVRALGTRHSFNDLADTEGTLITVTGIAAEPAVDPLGRTVTVGAGIRYGDLALWLEQEGWALHNMGSLPHISVGGAVATGTHGSGVTNGALSDAVQALEYVNADGDVVVSRRGDADFAGLVVGLGSYGITVRVTLDIQPSYDVRQDVYTGMSWDALLANFDEVVSAAYSVSVFTLWGTDVVDQIWRKTRLDDPADVPDEWHDARRNPRTGTVLVGGDPSFLTEQGGIVGRWLDRLPHFRHDSTPSNGDEIQTEYFVDRADAPTALRAVRELAEHIDPYLLITELRTIAADNLWLSGAYERDTLGIHFTWKNLPAPVREALPRIEAALRPFGARPHWGKWHTFTAQDMAAAHPRLDDARALFERLDPGGRFANDHVRRLGVRASDRRPKQ